MMIIFVGKVVQRSWQCELRQSKEPAKPPVVARRDVDDVTGTASSWPT
jgi:hypothetical protein